MKLELPNRRGNLFCFDRACILMGTTCTIEKGELDKVLYTKKLIRMLEAYDK